MSSKQKKSQAGFSLIELMVVVAIMAILAVIGLGGFSNAQKKARDSRRKADVKTIQNAMVSSTDTGGNFDAIAAMNELSGSFPVDPRKVGGVNEKYFLYSPIAEKAGEANYTKVSGQINFVPTPAGYNSGVICSVLEAPDTGNASDARQQTGGAEGSVNDPRKTASEVFSGIGFDQLSTLADVTSQVVKIVNNDGSITISDCRGSEEGVTNCNLFCATF